MTIMRVSLVGSPLDAEASQAFATALIDAFAEVEVGTTSPEIRQGFLVQLEHVSATDLYMGDRPMAAASEAGKCAVVTTQVMAGPWNAAMKRELFSRIEAVVRAATGMPRRGNGADFWMTCVEVPEGGWGLGGNPVSIGQLAPVFDEERQARIRAHLAGRGGT